MHCCGTASTGTCMRGEVKCPQEKAYGRRKHFSICWGKKCGTRRIFSYRKASYTPESRANNDEYDPAALSWHTIRHTLSVVAATKARQIWGTYWSYPLQQHFLQPAGAVLAQAWCAACFTTPFEQQRCKLMATSLLTRNSILRSASLANEWLSNNLQMPGTDACL